MAKTQNSISLTEEIYLKIYKQILDGELKIGNPINISKLKEQYGVSLAVIREALIKLTSKGIVVQKPNLGFAVVSIDEKSIKNIIEARIINEGEALRSAMKNGDMGWESGIVAKKYELDNTPMFLDKSQSEEAVSINPLWLEKHYEFHMSMLKACDNEILLSICDDLWNLSRVYRNQALYHHKDRKITKEHEELMKAVLERNEEAAIKLFVEHLEKTGKIE